MAWGGRIIEGKRNTAGSRPPSRGGEFAPTIPLPDPQEPARRTEWNARSIVTPQNVHPQRRPLLLLVTAIFGLAWAAVGVLSGHMHVVPFHFDGRAALCVSAAILAGATALAIQWAHTSGQDDLAVWNWWMRQLGWVALACLLSACLIELVEWLGLLPDTDGSIGLLSTEALQNLCASPRLARWLRPHHETLQRWTAIGAGSCLVWVLLLRLWTRKELSPHGPGSALGLVLVLPAAVCGTLLGIESLASGGPLPRPSDWEDDHRATLAFTQTMTLLGLVISTYLVVALRQAVRRAPGR